MCDLPQNVCQCLPPTMGPIIILGTTGKPEYTNRMKEASAFPSKSSGYFKKTMPKDEDFTPAGAEGALTRHSVNHDFLFRSNNCCSK